MDTRGVPQRENRNKGEVQGGTLLFCCHKYFYQTEKKYLLDTEKHRNRILETGICPKCGTLKVSLTYTDLLGNKKETKPKKKKAKEFITECLSQPYYEIKDLKIKFGTKNNMFWLFQTNGTIKDFNNTVKGDCKTEIIDTTINALLEGAFS